MTCKHNQKYTEKVEGEKDAIVFSFSETMHVIRTARNSSLRTYCTDCGVLLKDVELEDCFTR